MRRLMLLSPLLLCGCMNYNALHSMSNSDLRTCSRSIASKVCIGGGAAEAGDYRVELLHRELDGNHKLRKMIPPVYSKDKDFYLSGGYFLFFGNIEGESKTTELVRVTFAWQMLDGAYAVSSHELKSIRVELNDSITEPYVYFQWTYRSWMWDHDNLTSEVLGNMVDETTVVCRPSDWPIDISLPLNKVK